mgnify:CR=1 FL=1
MDWKNTPRKVKKEVEKADKKAKSGGDPHGRTIKEKVTDFAKGVGLTSKQKTAREFLKGGLIGSMGTAGALASRAANVVKKAHAHKKE